MVIIGSDALWAQECYWGLEFNAQKRVGVGDICGRYRDSLSAVRCSCSSSLGLFVHGAVACLL